MLIMVKFLDFDIDTPRVPNSVLHEFFFFWTKRNISLSFFLLWKNWYVSRFMFTISFSTSLGKCNFDLGFCEWANDLVSDNTGPWKLSSYRNSKRSVVKRPDHGGRLGKEIFWTLVFRFQCYMYMYMAWDLPF